MFELRDSFDALASAEKLPYSKPHPQVYLDCAAKLGLDPLNCVALEDSVNGMVASKAARMRSIVVPAEEGRHDPRFALADVKLNHWQNSRRITCGRLTPVCDKQLHRHLFRLLYKNPILYELTVLWVLS
jgi:beta-phosphoglucomutase-like phosphatase (HAD superfamily)